MTTKLMTVNEPTLNGRTYSADVVQTAIDNYIACGKPIFVERFMGGSGQVNIENAAGIVEDLKIEGNSLMGTIKIFPGNEPLLGLSCRPAFIGKISKEGIVTEAELISFAFTADPA